MERQDGIGACAVCTRACQSTHGKGLLYSVPRFLKAVADYSTPSRKNCNMQIPAGYVRKHIGKGAKHSFILEGVSGSEWEVTFNSVGLSGGWKAFATDYHLEKGDQVMFGLVAPDRFYVNVFDKFGLEKVSTREPLDRRGRKETEPQNGAAERFHTPLQALENGKRCGEQKSNSAGELTMVPEQNMHSNGVCADDTSPVMASDQNGNHQGSGSKLVDDSPSGATHSPQAGHLSLIRTLEFDPARALIEKLLSREAVGCDELEPSEMSDSMSDSEDSVQVLLAKAVLAKMRRKKLKKRKSSDQVEVVTEAATKSGGTPRTEVSTPLLNEDKSNDTNRDRSSKILRNLETDDVTDNLRDDETGARGETELEKSCEGPSNGHTEYQIGSIHPQGAGDSNQNVDNGTVPQPDEATAGVVNGEDSVAKRAGELRDEPRHVTLAALVKEEPDLRNALGPDMTATGIHNGACVNCGLATIPDQDHIRTPPPNLTCEIPETRTPSSDAPGVRATDVRKQRSAKTSGPDKRTPSSNGRPKGHGKVTEDQKQKALEAANTFSASTKNPSAVVVMRISFVEKTFACFVSVKCAEMLPKSSTEITLVDSEGCLRKANWRPERRYMQGPGWKEFVDSKNLQVNDVCVMEVIEKSSEQCKVLIHIFHAHEMDVSKNELKEKEREQEGPKKVKEMLQEEPKMGKEMQQEEERELFFTPPPVIPEVSPGARTRHQEKRSPGASQMYGLLPSKGGKRRKKSPSKGPSSEDGVTEAQLTEEAVATPGSSKMQEESLDSTKERHSSKRERKKVRMFAPLQGPKQTPNEEQSRKQYSVAKLVDRRSSLHGIVFLVELKEAVVLDSSSNHKWMKTKQDEKGRWWVPHSHFTSDFSSCYIG